ncbi:MAG TPA: MCE family protein [Actinomycetota bacterium]|nr:MCE family protein [Actinomycetota bacterium]
MSIKNFRERSPFLIGILSILGITAGTALSFSLDKIPFVKQSYSLTAEFADAAGLNPENQVRVAGIKVGTVESVQLDGTKVVVEMEIDNGTEIPEDATAEIKLATLLGTKFVEIDGVGDDPFLADGDVIPLERTEVPYEIYQAANEGTKVLEGLNGPQLNKMLVQLTKLTAAAEDEVGEALEGLSTLGAGVNAREDELKALLAGADELTALLADEGDEVVRLIDASNDVLGSLAGKREEIQSLLEVTRQMAGEVTGLVRANRSKVDSIVRKLDRALGVVESNLEHIDMALEYAGPSSRYFGNITRQGRWADIFSCVLVVSAGCENDE